MKNTLILTVLIWSVYGATRETERLLENSVSWKDNEILDKIIDKDPKEVYKIYGSLKTLDSLNNTISDKNLTGSYIIQLRKDLSKYLEYEIKDEQEMREVLDFFVNENGISTAQKTKSLFTFTNILLIIAIIITVAAFGSVVGIWIVPLIANMPEIGKIILFYSLDALVIILAFLVSSYYSNYIGFLASLGFGGAYFYHLSTCPHHEKIPSVIFIPPLCVYTVLAVALHTQLIGFLAVAAFGALLGFSFGIGPLSMYFGFHDEQQAAQAIFPSACLIGIYIARSLGMFDQASYYMEVFDAGIFFIGSFVYFLALLILSSRWGRDVNYFISNIIMVCSIIAVCLLGFLVDSLSVFRGVGLTFAVFYLLQKYIEIPWGEYWSCGLLGGGLILIGLGFLLKSYGTYLIFWTFSCIFLFKNFFIFENFIF